MLEQASTVWGGAQIITASVFVFQTAAEGFLYLLKASCFLSLSPNAGALTCPPTIRFKPKNTDVKSTIF